MAAPKLLSLAILMSLVPSPISAANQADVIIVGAGVAGLNAGSVMTSKGVSVIVLEGRDRVGGRTWSKLLELDGKQAYAELGAAWVHGARGAALVCRGAQCILCRCSSTGWLCSGAQWLFRRIHARGAGT